MKVKLTVYFKDGTSGVVEIEKPAGALPDSTMVIAEGLLVAEKNGKVVSRIGRSEINPFSNTKTGLVIDEYLVTRDEVLKSLKMSMRPIVEKYKPLFH